MIYKKCLLLILLMAGVSHHSLLAQKRYLNEVFANIDSVKNITYGQAVNLSGNEEKLLLDVFSPQNDTVKKRPLLIFIHGGGFQSNSKSGAYPSLICNGFAKRGYVTASIDYRLGIASTKSKKDYAEAMYRAQQDGKAAVRFLESMLRNMALIHLKFLSPEVLPVPRPVWRWLIWINRIFRKKWIKINGQSGRK